jgi:hypothetical protein
MLGKLIYYPNIAMDTYQGKNIVKGATQMSGHSLKLHFYMFKKSQVKHNSLDCHKVFWNIFH